MSYLAAYLPGGCPGGIDQHPTQGDDSRGEPRSIMPEPSTSVPQPSPVPVFTPEHLRQIAAARVLGVKIHRAIALARVNGWVAAIFAGVTILGSVFSPMELLLGIGMGGISYFEFKGAAGLKRLDPTMPGKLAINQGAFAAILLLYGAINLLRVWHDPSPLAGAGSSDPQLAQMLAPFEGLARNLYLFVYVAIILAAVSGPGLMVVYYQSRRKYIEAYLRQTPAWIQELQRAGMSI